MADLKYDIKEELGIISEGSRGWKKELNFVSWNDREPKYDIRDWDEEHTKMGKGLTLTRDELKGLKELLNKIDL